MKHSSSTRRVKLTIAISVIVTCTAAVSTYAWNLICGVSIGFTQDCASGPALLTRQYQVDSRLLAGSGEYYLAISDLQLVDIDAVRKNGADQPTMNLIRQAEGHLKASNASFTQAVEEGSSLMRTAQSSPCRFSATERATANQTLREAKRLVEFTAALQASLARGVLPRVDTVHSGVASISTITKNGIQLSKQHIGRAHHSYTGNEEIRLTK